MCTLLLKATLAISFYNSLNSSLKLTFTGELNWLGGYRNLKHYFIYWDIFNELFKINSGCALAFNGYVFVYLTSYLQQSKILYFSFAINIQNYTNI